MGEIAKQIIYIKKVSARILIEWEKNAARMFFLLHYIGRYFIAETIRLYKLRESLQSLLLLLLRLVNLVPGAAVPRLSGHLAPTDHPKHKALIQYSLIIYKLQSPS